MRVGVVGAGGKMGREVCRTVLAHPDLELVAAVDPVHGGADLGALIGTDAGSLTITGDLESLRAGGTEVAVDFTRLDAARLTLAFCADAGIHAVVGTTGFTASDLDDLERRFAGPASGAPNCVVAANFAIGAVLMMRFAEMAAPYFGGAEIVELHHDGKLDAPSGTAMRTAERMATAAAGGRIGRVPARRDRHPRARRGPGWAGPGPDPHPLGPAWPGWWPTRRSSWVGSGRV